MLTDDLNTYWTRLHLPLTSDVSLVDYQYSHLAMFHSGEERCYHNLSHIRQMITLWEEFGKYIREQEVVLFAIFFHDIIYNPLLKNNEEESAQAAEKYLSELNYPAEKITLVSEFILATKTHINTLNNTDLDYFLDFDLYILGTAQETYQAYAQQIRKEYLIYPDTVYKPGRKRLLQHFLEAPAIFHTPVFRKLYEENARKNIQAEMDTL